MMQLSWKMLLVFIVACVLTVPVLSAPPELSGARGGSTCLIPDGSRYKDADYTLVYSSYANMFPASALDGNLNFLPGTQVPNSIRIRIYCKKDRYGDAIHNSHTSQCRDGTWSPSLPSCKKRCGKIPRTRVPATPSEWSRPGATYKHGHTVSYKCRGNRRLVGNNKIVCRNGKWSKVQFKCTNKKPVSEPKSCKPLNKDGAVLQGPATPSSGNIPSGTVLSYQCLAGRVITGNSTVVCTDGKWSNDQFKCEMQPKENLKCGIFPWAENTYSSVRREHKLYDHGFTVKYTCWSHYHMTGNGKPTAVCENGQWTDIHFKCVPTELKGCKPLNKEDAVLQGPATPSSGNIPSGTVLSYQCLAGRVITGNSTVVCTDGKWSNDQFKCDMPPKENLKCGVFPWVYHAYSSVRREHKSYDHGYTVTYTCWDRYRMNANGKPTVVCENGQWTDIHFQCVPGTEKECGTLIVKNASPVRSGTVTGYPSGSSLTYKCTPGTFLKGNNTIVCKDGQWSDVKFSCERRPIYAPPPGPQSCSRPTVSNAVIDTSQAVSTFPSGGSVSFRCEPRRSMIGNSTIVCNDGKWSDVKFSCRKSKGSRKCYRLFINGAKPERISSRYEHGSVVEYKCKSGLQMFGSDSTAQCVNGRWYIKKFFCASRKELEKILTTFPVK